MVGVILFFKMPKMGNFLKKLKNHWPNKILATKSTYKFGAKDDMMIPMIKKKQSKIRDFFLPNFAHCQPPQSEPVILPKIIILAM